MLTTVNKTLHVNLLPIWLVIALLKNEAAKRAMTFTTILSDTVSSMTNGPSSSKPKLYMSMN